ncbi:MAG: 50S ribosomal protein L3 [Aquificaceae bacterium]|nr:50S ribosomal protein L3 [Aquificaceae bacterium]MCS7196711.1 50S ribosomal protein L3 [Aquificaceae bacterium]MCX7989810.1 50S ribosomal protein L3 [Aquificaceae bacterium]MDW8032593.1 50S ribosomal protein L3 [Aquificaceae bacterium]MDW8294021.1 50S ribosomal protein L3 [Aquificaceae bacterium]
MAIGLIGKKVGMTRVFLKDGTSLPVTLIQIKPNYITAVRTPEKEGYSALQVGAFEDKEKHLTKPELGHLKRVGKVLRRFREFRLEGVEGYQVGQVLRVEEVFQAGELVDVVGRSKGRGFAGTMKRWDFGGFPQSHGHRYHRAVGSIGNRSDPGRVWKSKRMAGHWGNEPIRVQSLLVLDVLPEYDLLLVKGSIPGPKGGVVFVEKSRIGGRRSQKLKLNRIKPLVENLLKEVSKDESA